MDIISTSVYEDRIIMICQGNPGALTVMIQIQLFYADLMNTLLSILESENIRGSDIWFMYKECNNDISIFIKVCGDLNTS